VTPYVAKAGLTNETNGEIINIGPTEEYSLNHVAEVVLKTFGRTDLQPIHVADRPREVKHAYCTNDKAKELLGYQTSTSLEEGISKMVLWAKTIGPTDFEYLTELELTGDQIPETWKNKTI